MRSLPLIVAILSFGLVIAGCSREPATAENGLPESGPVTLDHPADLADKAGVPTYPGAQMPSGKSSILNKGSETRYEIVMTTSDTPEKVQEFYQSKLQRAQSMPSSHNVMGMGANGSSVSVNAIKGDGGRTEIKAVAIVEGK